MWHLYKHSSLKIIPSPPILAALEKLLQQAIAAQAWLEAATIALLLRAAQPQTARTSFNAILADARQSRLVGASMPPSLPSELSTDNFNMQACHMGANKLLGRLYEQVCCMHGMSSHHVHSMALPEDHCNTSDMTILSCY